MKRKAHLVPQVYNIKARRKDRFSAVIMFMKFTKAEGELDPGSITVLCVLKLPGTAPPASNWSASQVFAVHTGSPTIRHRAFT